MIDLQNLRVLIFDFGGVIIDLDRECSVREFERLGVYNASELLSNYLQSGIFFLLESGKIGAAEWRNRLRLEYGIDNASDKEIDEAFFAFLRNVPEHRLALLRKLHGGIYNSRGERIRIVLLSNTNEVHFPACKRRYFESNGYRTDDYFDRLYLSYEMKMSKPDDEIFLALAAAEGVEPHECLFFDDGPANIDAANRLDFKTQLVEKDIAEYFVNV